MWVTVGFSVLAHAAALGGFAIWGPVPDPPERATPPRVAIVEPMPIEVIVIPSPGHADPVRRQTTRATTGAPAVTTAPAPSPEPTRTGTLAMRGPERPSIELPRSITSRTAEGPGVPVPPPAPVPSGKLEPAGREFVVHDAVTTIQVDQDGGITFHDKPDFDIHFNLPLPSLDAPDKMLEALGKGVGDMIDQWAADPYAQTRYAPVAEMAPHEQAIPGGWDSGDGTGSVASNTASSGTIPILGGPIDLTAWAIRRAGGDPYAARKQKLLDATFEERAAQGAVHRSAQLDRAAEIMRQNLERLWRRVADPAARRVAVFQLWDECEEGDGPRGEAGQRARGQVIGWIRARMPEGGSEAYSADEIARLGAARRSRQAFTPY